MTRRLVIAIASIAASVAVALSIPMAVLVARSEQSSIVNELRVETLATASKLASLPIAQWPAVVLTAPSRPDERVVVVDRQLNLVADSSRTALDREFNRPEILAALAGSLASDIRHSNSLGLDLRFVAAPIVQHQQVVAAVRFSLAEESVLNAVNRTVRLLAIFVIAITVVAGVIAWLLAMTIAAPVRALAQVAGRLHGDLSLRAEEARGPKEVREVASALNDTAERLFDLVRRTERVAAEASHHLRTPLTGIRLRLEAIEDMASDAENDEVADEARHALDEVDRLTHRIDQVLTLAKADARTAALVEVPASEAVASRVHAFQPLAEEQGVLLEARVEPGLVVLADAGAVPRIVDELIGNALHYARSLVAVQLQQARDHVELIIEDDGAGVPESELLTIFERFRRGSTAVPGGTGLGLAMVRETAIACGGTAHAERSSLGGLSVHVMFARG